MKTTRTVHLDNADLNAAVVAYLDKQGIVADPGNVALDVDSDGGVPVYSASVTECEDKPKVRRPRKTTQAEG